MSHLQNTCEKLLNNVLILWLHIMRNGDWGSGMGSPVNRGGDDTDVVCVWFQMEVLQESRMMIRDCHLRLARAHADLLQILVSITNKITIKSVFSCWKSLQTHNRPEMFGENSCYYFLCEVLWASWRIAFAVSGSLCCNTLTVTKTASYISTCLRSSLYFTLLHTVLQ